MFSIINTKKQVIGAVNAANVAVEQNGKFIEFNLRDVKSFNWYPDNRLILGFLKHFITINSINSAMANKLLMHLRKI